MTAVSSDDLTVNLRVMGTREVEGILSCGGLPEVRKRRENMSRTANHEIQFVSIKATTL